MISLKRIFSQYSYSLAALGIVTLFIMSLGFTMTSEIRHLIWTLRMGNSTPPSIWLWTTAILSITAMILVWYRIVTGAIRYIYKRNSLINKIGSRLTPLTADLPSELQQSAIWHMIEDSNCYAFTWGIVQQHIGISRGLWEALDSSGRQAVLYHESAHAVARDPLQQTILQTLSFSFGPFGMTQLYNRYLVRREILADFKAIEAHGGDDVPLMTALLTAVKSTAEVQTQVGLTGAFEARVEFLSTRKVPSWWDSRLLRRFVPVTLAIFLTAGQGILIWCH